MMIRPATKASSALWLWTHWPSTEAPAPKATNTVVNPKTKNTEASSTRRRSSLPTWALVICSMVVPPR
jgi:hypothetical protein